MNKGKLYLIPSPLGDNEPAEVLPAPVLELLPTLDCFVVEEVRTARRFLSRAGLKGHIDGLEFHELNEHTAPAEIAPLGKKPHHTGEPAPAVEQQRIPLAQCERPPVQCVHCFLRR